MDHKSPSKKKQAQVDKTKFRQMLGNPNSNVQHIEVWTDGAQEQGSGRLGSGLRVVCDGNEDAGVDMSWRVLGVGTNNGAELAPIAKIAEWLKANTKVTIYTDSESSKKLIKKIREGRMRDRDRINHPDRNAIMMIQQAMKRDPTVMDRIQIEKVTSHTGVKGK